MKNSFRRLALATAALAAFTPAAQAQDPVPANGSVVAGTLPDGGGFGVNIGPQNFPSDTQRSEERRWDIEDLENIRAIPVPPPREQPRSAINIGPFSVRESDAQRRQAGCRWTVKDEMIMRRCRW